METPLGIVEVFEQKVATVQQGYERLTNTALGDNEDPLLDITLSGETIATLTHTEGFLYEVSLMHNHIATLNREHLQECFEATGRTIESLNFLFDESELLPWVPQILESSETPLSDIVQSEQSDDFFEVIDLLCQKLPTENFRDNLVMLYLAEQGYLQSELSLSAEVIAHRARVAEENYAKSRTYVEGAIIEMVSDAAIAALADGGVLPSDLSVSSVSVSGTDDYEGDKKRLYLEYVPLVAQLPQGEARTRVGYSYGAEQDGLVKNITVGTIIFALEGASSDMRKKGPMELGPDESTFLLACLDVLIEEAVKLESVDPETLRDRIKSGD